jgi:hypothetical protein
MHQSRIMKNSIQAQVPSTFNGLTNDMKSYLKTLIGTTIRSARPWAAIVRVLTGCGTAFDDKAAPPKTMGQQANCIACIAHMLCDEKVVASLSMIGSVTAEGRPAMLDEQKATGISEAAAQYMKKSSISTRNFSLNTVILTL